MPRSVPRFRVLSACTETVVARLGSSLCTSRWWLPDVRTTTKPARSSARKTSPAVTAGNRPFMQRRQPSLPALWLCRLPQGSARRVRAGSRAPARWLPLRYPLPSPLPATPARARRTRLPRPAPKSPYMSASLPSDAPSLRHTTTTNPNSGDANSIEGPARSMTRLPLDTQLRRRERILRSARIHTIQLLIQCQQCRHPLHDRPEPPPLLRAERLVVPAVGLPIAQPLLEDRIAAELIGPHGLRHVGIEHVFADVGIARLLAPCGVTGLVARVRIGTR